MKTLMLSALALMAAASAFAAADFSEELDGGNAVRRVACYARNGRGLTFEAIGKYAPDTEERALNKCFRSGSPRCYAAGCKIVYVREGS